MHYITQYLILRLCHPFTKIIFCNSEKFHKHMYYSNCYTIIYNKEGFVTSVKKT
jgi:hypothetical protein